MYPVFVGAAGSLQTANVRTSATAFSFLPSTGNLTIGGTLSINTNGNAIALLNGGSNAVGNIGSSSSYFNQVFAQATTALYADLAEMYYSDAKYEPGTVISFGGSQEVTITVKDLDSTVAGVVSTNPAYLMNNTLTENAVNSKYTVPVALQGRVPVKVQGTVKRGDMLVSAGNGRARAENFDTLSYRPGTVLGKALTDFEGEQGTIEMVVGRL
jgi:hypothetical protein